MALKFAANLNFLFTERATSIAERIRLAHQNGFRAVEIPYPDGETSDVVSAVKETGVVVSLVNLAFDKSDDQLRFGSTSVPGSEKLFRSQLDATIDFARQVNCNKIHLTAGLFKGGQESDYTKTYTANLKIAADSLRASKMIGVIEPINKYAVPGYYMNSYSKAAGILADVAADNIQLLADLYHLQHLHGNVSKTLEEYKALIGHFQIAQVPHRHEPDVSGELDYGFVFKALQEFGYDGWVGCEYKPKTTTVEGLGWVSKLGYTL
ncbi:putative hydroxypyruvate isomerase [Drosophila sechellia]|uniref:Putative hydroxypyruvate isomerase n=1 Tax=Drosophila sechellia TaxID=7238 RepID=B4IDP4_DROSE|nr:putative hydroxypyruvate isomerase [Drosophila sechellia]EDW45702.1 GM11322 [Drosophila sechellia]